MDVFTNMCIDMCTNMCRDMCTDMYTDMYTDMCTYMCTDMYTDMCIGRGRQCLKARTAACAGRTASSEAVGVAEGLGIVD